MKREDIHLDDLWRIFVGEVPAAFFIEIIIRTAFIFLVLMLSIRLLGKRMAGQLNKIEMISLTTLAAAVGVPLQAPDRGLLPAFIIAAIVVIGGLMISRWSARSVRFEAISQDTLSLLVKDSILQLKTMRDTKITRDRLFSFLRASGFTSLGSIERVYLEAGGFFTIVERTEKAPGLLILPAWDKELVRELTVNDNPVCTLCGTAHQNDRQLCAHCSGTEWVSPGM